MSESRKKCKEARIYQRNILNRNRLKSCIEEGEMCFNSTTATKLYMNLDVQETQAFMASANQLPIEVAQAPKKPTINEMKSSNKMTIEEILIVQSKDSNEVIICIYEAIIINFIPPW